MIIEVSDTGIGIDPSRLAEVFEPFVQVDASSTKEHGGTGLGLAIATRLAGELGGRIEAASVPGRGTTFTLFVPTRPPNGVPAARPPTRPHSAVD